MAKTANADRAKTANADKATKTIADEAESTVRQVRRCTHRVYAAARVRISRDVDLRNQRFRKPLAISLA